MLTAQDAAISGRFATGATRAHEYEISRDTVAFGATMARAGVVLGPVFQCDLRGLEGWADAQARMTVRSWRALVAFELSEEGAI